jgi:hypothetical protein
MGMIQNGDDLARAVHVAVKAELERIMEEEVAKAQQRVAERINAVTDRLVLGVLQNYSVMDMRNELLIRVQKAKVAEG